MSLRNLNPGGYIEVTDKLPPFTSDDDSLQPNSALHWWSTYTIEGTEKTGRMITAASKYKQQLVAAGFINIVEKRFKWPTNTWPKDPVKKKLGTRQRAHKWRKR